MAAALLKTPLDEWHRARGAKLAPFAGYRLPLSYGRGILAEHAHTREQASLFDVSHMGQILVRGAGAAEALETVLPLDLAGLAENRQCYGVLLNGRGGAVDDLMIARRAENEFFLVVNAARKERDGEYLRQSLPPEVEVETWAGRALLALQGPAARAALSEQIQGVEKLSFLQGMRGEWLGAECYVTCSGYTGEDGFEVSLPAECAVRAADALLADPRVAPAGLGARDTLRLEAGLCLYGNELDEDTTPVEAGLSWSIAACRRRGGDREGGFAGAEVVLAQLEKGAERRRCALVAEGREILRAGAELHGEDGALAGKITSGNFSPTLRKPIALASVSARHAAAGGSLEAVWRGQKRPAKIVRPPFVAHRYHREQKQ